jgi:serine/threonine protein kinase
MEVIKGEVLAGKYRIENEIGRGGGGVVVAATHLQLEQRVALKFLSSSATEQPEAPARFAREARAAASIRSEHVARVLDVDKLESGTPFMVMEYLEGCDLSEYMSQRGQLSVAEAAELTLQACEALAEAHSLRIIHRDLKPANLFLARYADRTCIKILDFGISKMGAIGSAAADLQMTSVGTMMGSPCYMSPEQIRSAHRVDARADIWAVGVVLYELVTGRLPFLGETLAQVCWAVMTERPQPIRKRQSDISPRFETLVLRCLEKDYRRRFANVLELASDLAEFAPSGAAGSLERISKFFPPPRVREERTPAGFASRRLRSRGVVVVAIAAALLGGSVAWRRLSSRGPRAGAAVVLHQGPSAPWTPPLPLEETADHDTQVPEPRPSVAEPAKPARKDVAPKPRSPQAPRSGRTLSEPGSELNSIPDPLDGRM